MAENPILERLRKKREQQGSGQGSSIRQTMLNFAEHKPVKSSGMDFKAGAEEAANRMTRSKIFSTETPKPSFTKVNRTDDDYETRREGLKMSAQKQDAISEQILQLRKEAEKPPKAGLDPNANAYMQMKIVKDMQKLQSQKSGRVDPLMDNAFIPPSVEKLDTKLTNIGNALKQDYSTYHVDRTTGAATRNNFDSNKEGFTGNIKEGWMQGQVQNWLSTENYRAMNGLPNQADKLNKFIEEHPDLQPSYSEKGGDNWMKRATRDMVTQAPMWVGGGLEGAKEGLKYAIGFGATAAAASAPLGLGEVITVPAAMLMGFRFGMGEGMALYMARQEAAQSYVQQIQSGVDPEIAKPIAETVGALNGIIEVAQVGTLIKSVPGVKTFIERAGKMATKEAAKRLGKIAASYGAEVGENVLEEMIQQGNTDIGGEIAKMVHQGKTGEQLKRMSFKDIAGDVLQTGFQAAVSFSLMPMGGVMKDVGGHMIKQVATAKTAEAIKQQQTVDATFKKAIYEDIPGSLNEMKANMDTVKDKDAVGLIALDAKLEQVLQKEDLNSEYKEQIQTVKAEIGTVIENVFANAKKLAPELTFADPKDQATMIADILAGKVDAQIDEITMDDYKTAQTAGIVEKVTMLLKEGKDTAEIGKEIQASLPKSKRKPEIISSIIQAVDEITSAADGEILFEKMKNIQTAMKLMPQNDAVSTENDQNIKDGSQTLQNELESNKGIDGTNGQKDAKTQKVDENGKSVASKNKKGQAEDVKQKKSAKVADKNSELSTEEYKKRLEKSEYVDNLVNNVDKAKVHNESVAKTNPVYKRFKDIVDVVSKNPIFNGLEFKFIDSENIRFFKRSELDEAGYKHLKEGNYKITGFQDGTLDSSTGKRNITLYRTSSKDTIAEEIIHDLQKRIPKIDPELQDMISEWEENVHEQATSDGLIIPKGYETFAQAMVFSEMGYAEANPTLAELFSVPDEIVERFNAILGDELVKTLAGESMPELKKNIRMLNGKGKTVKSFDPFDAENYDAIRSLKERAHDIDFRLASEIGKRGTKSIIDTYPEFKSFYQEMAGELLMDLMQTVKAEKSVTHSENGVVLASHGRVTSDSIASIKDSTKATYKELQTALENIADGKVTTALARRIELVIDENLTLGYTDFSGKSIPANKEYLDLKYGDESVANYQIKPMEDPNFKKWFEGSKVVDEKGEPLVVYHGAVTDFTVYDNKKSYTKAKIIQKTHWFTDDSTVASEYSVATRYAEHLDNIDADSIFDDKYLQNKIDEFRNQLNKYREGKSKGIPINDYIEVIRRYSDINEKDINEIINLVGKNGYITEGRDELLLFEKLTGNMLWHRAALTYIEHIAELSKQEDVLRNTLGKGSIINESYLSIKNPLIVDMEGRGYSEEGQMTKIIKDAMKSGNDGVILKNILDGGRQSNHFVAFEPTQIKSVDNVGTWDPNNPDIRYQIKPLEDQLIETNKVYETNKEELKIAEAAITDLQEVENSSLLFPTGRTVSSTSGIRTIGKAISTQFVKQGFVKLKGRKVTSAHDVAEISQVFRDPRFETFRYIYTKGDKIVGYEGVTSRIPSMSAVFLGMPDRSKYSDDNWYRLDVDDAVDKNFNDIKDRMKRLKADGFYILHNHPSGHPTPSPEDISITKRITKNLDGFKGHVVINSNKYAVIPPNSDWYDIFDLERPSLDLLLTPETPHPLLNQKINGSAAVAGILKTVNSSQDFATLIFASVKGEVRGIMEIPNGMFNDIEKLKGFIRNQSVEFGSGWAFVGTKDDDIYQKCAPLVKQNYLMDAVKVNGNGRDAVSQQENGVRPQTKEWAGIKTHTAARVFEGGGDYNAEYSKPVDTFYSTLQNVLDAKMPRKASADQVMSIARSGAKAEEIKWSGIEDFLDGKDKVDKEELLQYLKDNEIKIEETTKKRTPISERDEAYQNLRDYVENYAQNRFFGGYDDRIRDAKRSLEDKQDPEYLRLSSITREMTESNTKYGMPKYILPGGSNYREMLFTLPIKKAKLPEGYNVEQLENGRWTVRNPEGYGLGSYDSPEQAEDLVLKTQSNLKTPYYQSGHWDEKNVLAHTRLQDFIDAEGNRILFVDEIQSDWFNEGRERGYKTGFNPSGALTSDAYKQIKDEAIAVPDAPFVRGSYYEFVLKRLIRYAADHGYDGMAWVKGDQHKERYDLSKQVSLITYEKLEDGNYEVFGFPIGDEEATVFESKPQNLADHVGKEIAEKILNSGKDKGRIEGVDLKVGGEGKNKLYDEMIPSFLKKYLKKWKVELQDVKLGTPPIYAGTKYEVVGDEGFYTVIDTETEEAVFTARSEEAAYDYLDNLEGQPQDSGFTYKQPGFLLNDEMKNSAVYEGQPLYQLKSADQKDNEFFTVDVMGRKIPVFKNPTEDQMKYLNERFEEENPSFPSDEIKTRSTYDQNGNEYRWVSTDSNHWPIEEYLKRVRGIKAHQYLWNGDKANYQLKEAEFDVNRRGFYDTVEKSPMTDEALRAEVKKTAGLYVVKHNKDTVNTAIQMLYDMGTETATKWIMGNSPATAEMNAIAMMLIKMASDRKNIDTANELLDAIAAKATTNGQASQILSMYGMLSPEGMIRYARKTYRKLLTEGQINEVNTASDKLEKELRDINKKAVDDVDLNEAMQEIAKLTPEEMLAKKIGNTLKDKKSKEYDPVKMMVDTLFKVYKETADITKEKPIDNTLTFIAHALTEREEYRDVWNKAREIVKELTADDPNADAILQEYFDLILMQTFPDSVIEKAVRTGMKDLKIKLDKIVRQHFTEVNKTTETLAQKLVADAGLNGYEALMLSDYVERTMNKFTAEAKTRVLNRMFKDKSTTERERKTLAQRIIEISNLGGFQSSTYKNLVAAKLGFPAMTEEMIKSLDYQAQNVQTMEEGHDKDLAIAKMLDLIAAGVPVSFARKLNTLLTIAQLLNAVTIMRNIVGNTAFQWIDRVSRNTMIPLDVIASAFTGQRTKTYIGMTALKDREGDLIPKFGNYLSDLLLGEGFKEGWDMGLADAKAGVDTSGNTTQYDLPRSKTFRMKEWNLRNSANNIASAAETAMTIALRVTDRAAFVAAFTESIKEQMKIANVKEATAEMINIASADGYYRTFQDSNAISDFFVSMKRTLNKIGTQEMGAGDFLLKYPKTPGNLLARAIDYSPLGLISVGFKLLYDTSEKDANGKKKIVYRPFSKWQYETDTSKYLMQKQAVEGIGRVMTGTVLIGTGYLLAKLGIIAGKGDDDWDVYYMNQLAGLDKYQLNYSALLRWIGSGFNPDEAARQQGDTLMSYDWMQPFATNIVVGADLALRVKSYMVVVGDDKDRVVKVFDDKTAANNFVTENRGRGYKVIQSVDGIGFLGSIVSAIQVGSETLANQPLLQGIQKAFGARDPVSGALEVFQSVPASFVPTLFRQISQLIDNEKKSSYDIRWSGEAMRLAQRKIPGLASNLEPNLDVLGETQKYYADNSNPLTAAFYTFISPAIVKKYDPSPEAKFVLDLYDKFGDKRTVPKKIDKSITVEGVKIRLTPAELTTLQEFSGKQIKARLSNEAAQDTETLSEETQIKRIDNIYSEVYNEVKEKIRKMRGIPKK